MCLEFLVIKRKIVSGVFLGFGIVQLAIISGKDEEQFFMDGNIPLSVQIF